MINVISRGLALAILVGCSFFSEISIKKITASTNVSGIGGTRVNFFGPLPKFQSKGRKIVRVSSRIRAE